MRRPLMVLAASLAVSGALALPAAAVAVPAVRTVVGAGGPEGLSSPGGIALDTAGDLFVADTDHCRVIMVASHSGTLYGRAVAAHHPTTLVGGGCGGPGALGYPTGVAVDHRGDVYVAEATDQRVQMVRPGSHVAVTVAGTGVAGYNGNGQSAVDSELDEPGGVAVDAAGNLFIADTANCRVRFLPAADGTYDGAVVAAGHLYSIAGTGVCGSGQQGGPAAQGQLWNPVAVAVDPGGDLFIADAGDQSVLEVPAQSGTAYGTPVTAGDLTAVVGPAGNGNGPYAADGLPALGPSAEFNDPEGLAVGPNGTLLVTDGTQHAIRAVADATVTMFGRTLHEGDLYTLAGSLTVADASGLGDGTRWVLTHMGVPVGITLAPSGAVLFSDRSTDQVRSIG